jgi:hypothetical protein
VDVYGYGNQATCYEFAPGGEPGILQAATRQSGGMSDTDDNSVDFFLLEAAPRNSSSPRHPGCLLVPTRSSTWGHVKTYYR